MFLEVGIVDGLHDSLEAKMICSQELLFDFHRKN